MQSTTLKLRGVQLDVTVDGGEVTIVRLVPESVDGEIVRWVVESTHIATWHGNLEEDCGWTGWGPDLEQREIDALTNWLVGPIEAFRIAA